MNNSSKKNKPNQIPHSTKNEILTDNSESISSKGSSATSYSLASGRRISKVSRLSLRISPLANWGSTLPESTEDLLSKSDGVSQAANKTVRFCKTVLCRRIVPSSYFTDAAKAEIWYSAKERWHMKKNARSRASKHATRQPDCVQSLCKVFHNAVFLAATSRDSTELYFLLKDEQFCTKSAGGLVQWACHDRVSYRGLEESTSRYFRQSRKEFISEAREIVGSTSHGRKNYRDEDDLATQYRELTKASVIFARLLAHTDEIAARKIYKEE